MSDSIHVEMATVDHRNGILQLAKDVYIKSEPVRVAMKVEWKDARAGWEKSVDECLKHPCSHVAINSKNEVIGFRLSRILDVEKLAPEDSINDFLLPGPVRTIEDFLTRDWASILVDDGGGRCTKLLQFVSLCVHGEYGGRGLAMDMCMQNMMIGKEMGCQYVSVVASNWMSQRVFDKLGFVTKASVLFDDLKDENGKRLFDIKDPKQTGSKWQVKKL